MEELEKTKANPSRNFRLGLNYWPASKAMYWWKFFDPEEVQADFHRISQAGFDSVRIFLLWEDFQPTPTEVSTKALKNLLEVADIAFANGLQLVVTFFTGHMSGVNWIPRWALEEGIERQRFRVFSNGEIIPSVRIKNWYEDSEIIKAQEKLISEVVSVLRDHNAIWAWDLGNENSNCVIPSSRGQATKWLEKMAEAIRKFDQKPVTIGLHAEDLEEDRLLGPKEAASVCDFLCMHGYPIYSKWVRSPTDAFSLPFLGLITKWLGGGKDVLFEEFGVPTISDSVQTVFPIIREEEAAEFVTEAMMLLHKCGFIGAMLWCYSDYSENLWNKPPFDEAVHERYFGLWSVLKKENRSWKQANLSEKKVVGKVREFAELVREIPEGVEEFSKALDFSNWIDISPEEFYLNPFENLQRLYRRFLRVCECD
ncbi:MAG: hypothetical protein D6687_10820 [Acidobacteria bacterium]|jgi:endo-1,4-beta-mannosidase|nr:MAG: hypothetical protein D6687_10820 [Acidobacteriota bacterium]GIU81400.1 MAG: hypothetical protein KatS3mg006_0464 [Pyrinomonadaceae bacterium]